MPEEKKSRKNVLTHVGTTPPYFFTSNTCEFTQRLHVFNILESETPQQPNSFHQQLPARMKHWVQKLAWQHIKSLPAIEIGPFWGPRPLIEWMAYHLVTWGSAEGISCRTKRISFLCTDARRPALIRRFLETVFGATFTALQPLATHPASLRAPFHFLTLDRTPKHWAQVISAIGFSNWPAQVFSWNLN
jgi:hypothetical protein